MLRIGFVLALTSCTSATGEIRGGEARFDAAASEPFVQPNPTHTEPNYTGAPSTSWKGIYTAFFGQRAPGSCAGNGRCHGTGGAGALSSKFVCQDLDGCYKSLTADVRPGEIRPLVDPTTDIATPAGADLFKVIRRIAPDGTVLVNANMPLSPRSVVFSQAEVERIQQWISGGAKND